MKVYVVAYGWKYEGEDEETMKVFLDADKAAEYAALHQDIIGWPKYDYAITVEREVIE